MGTAGLTLLGVGAFVVTRYRVCKPNQYLVKTGLGIKNMSVARKAIQWPFQKAQFVEMNPKSYRLELNNMSKEKVPFNLPVVFTVAPYDPILHPDFFQNFATKMTNISSYEMEHTIKSVIHGETRILSADMTIEEMFSDKEKFKAVVGDKIQLDLNQFGIKICNANIEEMSDIEDNKYFTFRKAKAIEGANNEARVEVAEARKHGDIGEFERKAEARQRTAKIEADTVSIENSRERDRQESLKNLIVAKAGFQQETEVAQIQATMAATMRQVELEQATEAKRILLNTETERAKSLVAAKVAAEAIVQRAEGESAAKRLVAEADLYAESKRADGLKAVFDAQADGMGKLLASVGSNPHLLQFYLGMNSGLYTDLAKQNANALRGLAPKINVWNTGTSGDKGDAFGFLKQLMGSVPPMLDVLKQQTDIPILGMSEGYEKATKAITDRLQLKDPNTS